MDWRLRRAAASDAAALALVAGATFLQAFAGVLDGPDIVDHCAAKSSAAAFAAWLADPNSAVTLAEATQGHAPVGYTVLTAPDLPVEPGPADIELRRIYALASTHGSGIGPALMAQAVIDARAMGRTRLLLGVYGQNHRAHRFYERQGLTRIGTRQFRVGSALHDDFVYARTI
jgi:ribosomal protein S18 acetylase RimI-like enzyme